MFLHFPNGAAGLGVLALRLHVAAMACAQLFFHPHLWPVWVETVSMLMAVLVSSGLFTRLAAVLCIPLAVFLGGSQGGEIGTWMDIEALSYAAIVLLGAGAYSFDARLFGRRIIRLSD